MSRKRREPGYKYAEDPEILDDIKKTVLEADEGKVDYDHYQEEMILLLGEARDLLAVGKPLPEELCKRWAKYRDFY